MIDLVVFDMIGTTIQSSNAVPDAFSRALSTAGVTVNDTEIAAVRGKSKRAAIAELLGPGGDSDAVYAAFRSLLVESYQTHGAVPVEGAADTFAWCRDNGIDVALTTGFDRDVAVPLIDNLGWHKQIDALVCNDEVEHGRPAPDLILTAMRRLGHINVARVACVGDTVSDLEAGANAGTGINAGVLSGAHSREILHAAPHTAIIGSVADLPALLSA
jgi:phosphonatase-like hydrolase